MKKPMLFVVMVPVALVVVLTFLLIGSKIGLITQIGNAVSNELNILSFLGTITGGIMAASGIIVALVSVYSLFAIEQRTEQKFAELSFKQKTEYEQYTQDMFQAFALQLESVSNNDVEQAEELMKSALDLYPNLNMARRQMAVRLYNATELWFARMNLNHLSSDVGLNPMRVRNGKVSDGTLAVYEHIYQCQNFKPQIDGNFSSDAQIWLTSALENNEDTDGLMSLSLAKLYAMNGRWEKVLKYLAQASKLRDCTPTSIEETAIYLNVCRSATEISNLSSYLKWNAPMSRQGFEEWLDQEEVTVHRPSLELLAVRKERFLLQGPKRVFRLRVFKLNAEGIKTYQMQWAKETVDDQGAYVRIPNIPEHPGFSFDELWENIDDMCVLVSPVE